MTKRKLIEQKVLEIQNLKAQTIHLTEMGSQANNIHAASISINDPVLQILVPPAFYPDLVDLLMRIIEHNDSLLVDAERDLDDLIKTLPF